VALADHHEESVRIAAKELVASDHKAPAIRGDVADEHQVAAMVEQIVCTFGHLDAAFNNAGVQSPAVETADSTSEEFGRVNAINLRGVWSCMKYVSDFVGAIHLQLRLLPGKITIWTYLDRT
jgi:NAD(P)-dependent dehydrogenase (short-subunit alcohol dehydrogenase family)